MNTDVVFTINWIEAFDFDLRTHGINTKRQNRLEIMPLPSITVILGTIFMVYVAYSVFTLSQLFTTLQCSSEPCYRTLLAKDPKLQLNLFTSGVNNPLSKDVTKVGVVNDFDYHKTLQR